MSNSKIVDLAASIAQNTALVADYFSKHGLPFPSFDIDGPTSSQIPPDAPEIEAARVAIIESMQQLRFLMMGPFDYLASFTHDE